MIRYYLNDNCQEDSIGLEGNTIYKYRAKNIYIDSLNYKLKKFIDRGLIGYEIISNTGDVIYDSGIVDNNAIIDNSPQEPLSPLVEEETYDAKVEESNENKNITIYNNTTESNSVANDTIKKTRKRKVKDAE